MSAPGGNSAVASPLGLRSAVFASCAVLVSLTAHLAAGGVSPDDVTLLAAPVLVQVGHRMVSRLPKGPGATALALLGAELALHLLFQAAAPAGAEHGAGAAAHADCSAVLAGPVTGGALTAHHAGSVPGIAAMIAAHLASALLVGALLHRGEQALLAVGQLSHVVAGRLRCGARQVLAALTAHAGALFAALGGAIRVDRPDLSAPPEPPSRPGGRLLVEGSRFWRGPPAACAPPPLCVAV